MSRRMMCTSCFETAEPETLLAGSDRAELLSWLCFAAPGWLYCWWRHSLRTKVCATCGGGSLIREARHARTRPPPESMPRSRPRIHCSGSGLRWPRAFETPRDRLRHGGVGAVLLGACAVGWTSTAIATTTAAAQWFAIATSIACLGWIAFELGRALRLGAPRCSAWDDQGRSLSIELIY